MARKNTRAFRPLQPMQRTILDHLLNEGSITGVEANAVHKCRALPRRIADLKARGVELSTEYKVDMTGQRYARYHLVSCPAALKTSRLVAA